MMNFPLPLLSGLDTVEVAYYLKPTADATLDFDRLVGLRDELKETKTRHPSHVTLGSEEFLLATHGTRSGYPLLLENESFSIQCGPNNQPSFFVTYRSIALWHEGFFNLHNRFLLWAKTMGYTPLRPEKVSRIDYAMDFQIPTIDFNEDNFVSAFIKDNQHRKNGEIQTFRLGEGDLILRLYNK